jgi:RimJ/RimL family protein N-acetyltransferase
MARELQRLVGVAPPAAVLTAHPGRLAPPAPSWIEQLPLLVGARASLRELTRADAPALVAELGSVDVQRFIAPPPCTVASFENFILWAQCERARGRYACYGVVPHGMSSPAGVFQLRQIENGFGTAEWGFAIGASFWGAGYFTRSAVENGRANGALRKLGAVHEGVLRRAFRKDEQVMDAALWTILADEWRQARPLWNRVLVH